MSEIGIFQQLRMVPHLAISSVASNCRSFPRCRSERLTSKRDRKRLTKFQKFCKVNWARICGVMTLGLLEAIRHRNTSGTILMVFVFFQFSALGADDRTARAATAQESQGATILLDGTPIDLRITKRLSTAQAKVGDAVEFEVVHDVKVGDLVVVPRHALASGEVVLVKPRRRPMRNAELRVDVRTAKSITGSEVPIRGTRIVVGNFKYDPDAV
jgi:hypothetical protein